MIEVKELSKRYGAHAAVDEVSFRCEPGTVTGFLGPNGAGKSTTMRMICGLTPPSRGTATVNGKPFRDLADPGRQVGVLLDASAQHAGRTGREVLAISAALLGAPRSSVDEQLERVGLGGSAGGKRVRQYSLGMRQRLGLAASLIGDPSVLILDEPANGLDPEGIHWMRSLLRDFADRGGTVLLSSHLLREVEAVADRLVIIGGGRVVRQGSKEELLAGSGLRVAATDPGRLVDALERHGIRSAMGRDGALMVEAEAEQVGQVAVDARVVLTELRTADGEGLEELFLELTSKHDRHSTTNQEVAA